MYQKISFFFLSDLLEGGDEIRSLSMQFCDEILPPPNRHLFLNLKWWWAGATCFETDWPHYRPSTGGASSPGGSSFPEGSIMPRGRSMVRGEQHAQGEQLSQGEKHTKGGAACPGWAALKDHLSVKSKMSFCLPFNSKMTPLIIDSVSLCCLHFNKVRSCWLFPTICRVVF